MVEINNQTKSKIDELLIRKVAEAFLKSHHKIGHELSIAIIGDAAMRKINRERRRIDSPTDVLSFRGEGGFFGEIILDYSQIKKQARELKKSAGDELVFILVHGLLHLAGYDDRTEKERLKMIRLGGEFIKMQKLKIKMQNDKDKI
ncbi:MAG: rRNA maturation RNase YbeY [Patescibacteria group bacterium]|jgi:rRNA maturation RNase YbeY